MEPLGKCKKKTAATVDIASRVSLMAALLEMPVEDFAYWLMLELNNEESSGKKRLGMSLKKR